MDTAVSYHQSLKTYRSPEEVVSVLQPSYPVFCVRPHRIRAIARQFLEGFPGEVLYAVKCNPEAHILDTLYAAGIRHFDTASLAEVSLVADRLVLCLLVGKGEAHGDIQVSHEHRGHK